MIRAVFADDSYIEFSPSGVNRIVGFSANKMYMAVLRSRNFQPVSFAEWVELMYFAQSNNRARVTILSEL